MQLVVTPKPITNESLLGYLLRVSVANGYDTPWHVLTTAGIGRREAMSADFPINKLAPLVNCESKDLCPIAYSFQPKLGVNEYKILAHDLGQVPHMRTYRFAKPSFCAACVVEKGFLEAHWDLEGVTVCHIHGTALLTHCPRCGRRINWFRPDLLQCACGAQWHDVTLSQVSVEQRALANLVNSKVLGTEMQSCEMVKLPSKELGLLPLSALLGVINVIGKAASDSTDPRKIFEAASSVLAYWPSAYEAFIEKMIARDGAGILRSFQQSLAKAKIPIDLSGFLRQPIFRRLSELPPISTRIAKAASAQSNAKNKKHVPKPTVLGEAMAQRQAAAYLGIPVRALVGLRDSGHYVVRNHLNYIRAYHRSDLDFFRDKMLSTANDLHPTSWDGGVRLGQVLENYKLRSFSGKAEIIGAIIDGVIRPIGVDGKEIGDIILSRADVDRFVTTHRARVEGNTLSIMEVARKLDCDSLAIPALIQLGYLSAVPGPSRTRITLVSVDSFATCYVSLATVAKQARTLSRRLIALCSGLQIQLLNAVRSTGSIQPFIARADLPILCKTIGLQDICF